MYKIIVFFLFSAIIAKSQTEWVSYDTLTAKEKVEITYKKLKFYGDNCFDEYAFISSQLQPSKRKLVLSKLPNVVAIEIKKLKKGEFTQPIYFNKAWYIVKLDQKFLYKYSLNIIYLDESTKIFKNLPKN